MQPAASDELRRPPPVRNVLVKGQPVEFVQHLISLSQCRQRYQGNSNICMAYEDFSRVR